MEPDMTDQDLENIIEISIIALNAAKLILELLD